MSRRIRYCQFDFIVIAWTPFSYFHYFIDFLGMNIFAELRETVATTTGLKLDSPLTPPSIVYWLIFLRTWVSGGHNCMFPSSYK